MSAKKLDQSVFEGLPKEYRWAVIDHCGEVFVLSGEKPELNKQKNDWHFYGRDYSLVSCKYGDASDWQNSLIERQDVPTAADIDWSRQDVPAGATHFMRHPTALSFYRIGGDDGWEGYHPKKREWYFLQNTGEFFHKNLLEIPNKPESIHDVARSVEAARVAEKSMPYPDGDARYFETSDAVNNPAHYTTGGIECIDAMQAMLTREEFIGYLRGNIFKYQWRYKHKNGVEDLRKADWYAQRLIQAEGAK